MLNKQEIIDILFTDNLFWDLETHQEAKELFKQAFERYPELREKLLSKINLGLSKEIEVGTEEKETDEFYEYIIYDTLSELKAAKYKIPNESELKFQDILKRHPEWKKENFKKNKTEYKYGLSQDKDINSMNPDEILDFLLQLKNVSSHDLYEYAGRVGYRCSNDFNFCKTLFNKIKSKLKDFPDDIMNPIIWDLRPDLEKKEIKWENSQIEEFIEILAVLMKSRPEGKFWHSIPTLLERWYDIRDKNPDDWPEFYKLCRDIFTDFDFDRRGINSRTDWMTDALNHPFGTMTQIYLKYAMKIVNEKRKNEEHLVIPWNLLDFFEYIINNYNKGSRYGLCLTTQYLSWFEAVEPEWTINKLLPLFLSEEVTEQNLLAWTGYLWSNVLSKEIIKLYDDTYLKIVNQYDQFNEQVRNGFIYHNAYIFWVQKTKLENLYLISSLIDQNGRRLLIDAWEDKLKNANAALAEQIWQQVLLPYWKWSTQQGFFSLPDGNDLRIDFWRLIPFSYGIFKKAVRLAIDFSPEKIEHVGTFADDLTKVKFAHRETDEFLDFLISLIKVDAYPCWQKEEWLQLWDIVKECPKSNILKDELAKKRIL
ncbi:MAG: hypothetical protein ACOY90_13650 [Candidatus Zhuqueibacterota bacterium]